MTQYWLMKSEPDVFSIDDLQQKGRVPWDGVRNYRARNFMRDDMQLGDLVLFYHSSCTPPGVAGLARISRTAYVDHTAWDKKSPYYDAKVKPGEARWLMVDVEFVEKFDDLISLEQIRANADLKDMLVLQRGQRLSIQPVASKHAKIILKMAKAKTAP